MEAGLKELGEKLKSKRCEMNLSLKEVENATSIRSTYLQGIEEGRVQQLISPVYAQGFIRQYALFVGLDEADHLLKTLRHLSDNVNTKPQDFTYGLRALEMRGQQAKPGRTTSSFTWLVFGLAALVTTFFLARYLNIL